MKQKTSSSDVLTKQDLIDVLKDFGKDIDKKFQAMEVNLGELELRIDDKAQKYRNDVLTRFDEWAGELENAHEDRILSTKQLEEHGQRIKKLETTRN